MNRKRCELCLRGLTSFRGLAFFMNKDVFSIPPIGHYKLLCLGCYLSYLAQEYEMDNKEISSYINWTLKVAERK